MVKKKKEKGNVLGLAKSAYARKLLGRYISSYIIGILILIGIDYLQTEQPLVISEAVNAISDGSFAGETARKTLLWLAFICVTVFVGRILWRWFIFGASRKIERDMRNDLYRHLQTLDQEFFHEHKAGEIMAYMSSDIETVRMAVATTVMMGMDTLVIGIATIWKMITRIDLKLSILSFIPMVFVIIASFAIGDEMHRRYIKRQEAFSALADFVQEKLNGMKVIKAFVQEEKEWLEFDKANMETRVMNIRDARVQAFMWPFMRLIGGLSIAIAVGYGGYIAIEGTIDVGQFSGFIMYLNMLVWPMASIGRIINIFTRGSASMKRIEAILNVEPGITDGPEAESRGIPEGKVEARGLTFRYSGEEHDVLKNVSFTVEKGQTLGIVGKTGAGKTTLVNLIMRVCDSSKGQLFIGGREIHTIPLSDLRRAIGCVPQDNFLFSDTIAANISFGDRSKSRCDIESAACSACVHDNIIEFSDGYDTIIGERGVSLSGGQKQRISIARALILDPEILILDDSVSAVDTDTEEQILRRLRETRKGKTNIIIAHRISTIQHADKIIVIDGNTIAETGTHDELVAMNGIYADMYRRQLLEKMKKEEFAL